MSNALEELRKGAEYEKYINTQFLNLPKKSIIPVSQEEVVISEDPLRLQTNLSKANLKEIITGSPALINNIIEDLKLEDGDLIEFNKYFPIFKKTISGKIKSLKQFRDDYQLFKDQQLGTQLTIMPITTESKLITSNQKELESMTNEQLDTEFRKALEQKEKKLVDQIDSIRYITTKGAESQLHRLTNKDGILSLDPLPKGRTGESVMQRINNVKIRYVLKSVNPTLSLKGVDVSWNPTTTSTSGSGLNRPLKKKWVLTNYH